MKKIIMTLLLVVLSISLARELQDVVKLKNGSIIRGIIVKQIPSKSISIETKDGNLFVYQMEEVEEITKEEVRRRFSGASVAEREGKAYGLINVPYSFGFGDDAKDTYMFGTKIIGGKQLNNNFALGIGSGFNHMGVTGDGDAYVNYIPLYADIRINFRDTESTPYLFVDPGYGFVSSATGAGGLSGGFYFNAGLGIRNKLNDNSDFDFSVSYMLQKTKWEYSYSYNYGNDYYITQSDEGEIKASYFSIMLGFYFM